MDCIEASVLIDLPDLLLRSSPLILSNLIYLLLTEAKEIRIRRCGCYWRLTNYSPRQILSKKNRVDEVVS
jgi:hypothetical protein